jgi:CHAT domain-containing protein
VFLTTLSACSGPRDQAAAAAEEMDGDADSLVSLLAEGEGLYASSEYDSASVVWQLALKQVRSRNEPATEAWLLTWLGLAAWRLGEYAHARRLGEAALELELRHSLDTLLPRSYNALGLLAWYEGRLSDAVQLYSRTTAAARGVGDYEYLGKAANNLGLVYFDFGKLEEARDGFLAAQEAGRELGDGRAEGDALTNLGMLEVRTGNPRAAIPLLRDALHAYRSAGGYRTGEEAALGQLVAAYQALGEPRLAIAVLDSALAIARDVGLRREEAANLESLADVYREAGDLRRALELYEEANAINVALGLVDEVGANLRRHAEVLATLGSLDRATTHAAEALETHHSIGARFAELADLLLLGELAAARGREGAADMHLRAARDLALELGSRSARVDVALAQARIADARGDGRGVVRALNGIGDDLVRLGYSSEWEVHALWARALARAGDLEGAADRGGRAVVAVERVRSGYGAAALRTTYLADKAQVYTDLVDVLLELGRTAEALAVSDAARGRALLEHLSYGRPTPDGSQRTADADTARRELLRRIDRLASSIREYQEFDDLTAIRELEESLEAARREYHTLALHGTGSTTLARGEMAARRIDLDAIHRTLRPDEALVEYLVAPDRVFIFVVTALGVRSLSAEVGAAEIDGRVRLARDLLADRGAAPRDARFVLRALHQDLLGAVLADPELAGLRRLIIVPQGALTYLPFGALWNADAGRYLVEDYSLLFLPSAAALPVLRSRRRDSGGAARVELEAVAFAPLPRELPASRAEAQSVRRALAGELYVGRRATEPALRSALAQHRVVHVASHGVLNVRNPLFSRIEMAGGNALEVHEVLELTIQSPLVFLSGCETGLGAAWATSFAPGEDYATLEQAFLYSGAQNVIATLWPVEDAGSAEFAKRFYDHLTTAGPSRALALAQREMMSHPEYGRPHYWAAYRLAGDGLAAAAAQNRTPLSVQ